MRARSVQEPSILPLRPDQAGDGTGRGDWPRTWRRSVADMEKITHSGGRVAGTRALPRAARNTSGPYLLKKQIVLPVYIPLTDWANVSGETERRHRVSYTLHTLSKTHVSRGDYSSTCAGGL